MDHEERKLIDQIREGLYHFEIPYEEGSWEDFERSYGAKLREGKSKPRRPLIRYWKHLSAAALLIAIMTYMTWQITVEPNLEINAIRQPNIVESPKVKNSMPTPERTDSTTTVALETRWPRAVPNVHKDHLSRPASLDDAGTTGWTRIVRHPTLPTLGQKLYATDFSLPAAIKGTSTIGPIATEQHLASAESPFRDASEKDKWQFGVEVNSAVVTDKINVAAGILTQFKIAPKIKLSTGLIYSRLSATHDAGTTPISPDTRILGAESTIQAIDIPLGIKYEATDSWYASVGISALAVLNENKIYRMESDTRREKVILNPESGVPESVFEVVTTQYQERSANTDFEGRSDLGYVNLSIGRKKRFNERSDLLFEPFVKIPIGGLRRTDVNLLNSGIKVKVLF